MIAYLIGHVTVKNADKWAKYRSRVPGTLAAWGAELVLRGKRAAVLTGEYSYADAVVIRFPNIDAIANWYSSPAYQALIPLRTEAAEMVLVSYEATA